MKGSGTVSGLMRIRAIVVVMAFAVLAACGGSGKPNAGRTPGTSTPTTPGSTATSSPGSTRSPTVVPTTPRGTPSKTSKPTPRATFSNGATATLSRSCARRGVDQETIVIKTSKGGPGSYRTQYSDGSYSGDGHSTYASGDGGGFDGKAFGSPKFDDEDGTENGSWQSTWTVPANAPLGLATVAASGAYGSVDLTFKVVAKDGHC